MELQKKKPGPPKGYRKGYRHTTESRLLMRRKRSPEVIARMKAAQAAWRNLKREMLELGIGTVMALTAFLSCGTIPI